MTAHRLFFHLTWSTHDRRPMINAVTRDFLDEFLRRTTIREGANVIELAFLRTHVHLLIRTPARFDFGRLSQMLKGGSSHAASRLPGNTLGLRWNRKYSVTTVSPRAVPRVIEYFRTQDVRHPGEGIQES